MNTIPKELQALAPGLRFCDAKHPGVSFAAERCPVCVVVDLNVTEITITAARTFNHPHEQYSNLRPEVVLRATLADGEDPAASVKQLQAKAEELVEDHKQNMLRSLEELYQLNERQSEVRGLERELQRAQSRLEEIRKTTPLLAAPEPSMTGPGAADTDEVRY
jgi:hypothetical protein